MSPRSTSFLVASVAGMVLLSGCGATSTATKSRTRPVSVTASAHISIPRPLIVTAASRQLQWVIGELNRGEAPSPAVLAAHFSSAFLVAVPPTHLTAALAPLAAQAPLRLAGVLARRGNLDLQAEVLGRAGVAFRASVAVSAMAPHRIDALRFAPLASTISSWSGVDAALERLAPDASMYAGYAGGAEVHALNGSQAGAIGSAFKLYVLGALADAVQHGRANWTTPLAIRESSKSLPSGDMRLQPAGRTFSLLHYAQEMISGSDNTAADHLIRRLGRAAVQAQLATLGNHSASRTEPFLTTREMFALKLAAPPSLINAYAAGATAERTRLLSEIDRLTPTLAEAGHWTTPRLVNTIEWFASPFDLAHAIYRLEADSQRPGLSPLREILAINPGVALNHTTWPYIAYKGGSEPGVVSTTWYLERRDGRVLVLSIILNNPQHAISTFAEISIATAAINLLAKA